MINITFEAVKLGRDEKHGRAYFLNEKFEEESVENAVWYFGRIANMLSLPSDTPLSYEDMNISFQAENETSRVQLYFGENEHITISEIIWEFANALTYTDKQCDEIINIIFNEEE